MRIEAALIGNLEDVLAAELKSGKHAVTAGTRSTVDWLKLALRAETMKAFSSQRLANTWRGATYPKAGESLGASGTVYSNAPHIIEAFSAATTIRGKSGQYLAIPTEDGLRFKGIKGKRLGPHEIEERLNIRLQFVYRSDGPSLLVSDMRPKKGKGGGYAAPSAAAIKRGDVKSVTFFILVPFVRLKQVFNLDQSEDQALEHMVKAILEVWNSER